MKECGFDPKELKTQLDLVRESQLLASVSEAIQEIKIPSTFGIFDFLFILKEFGLALSKLEEQEKFIPNIGILLIGLIRNAKGHIDVYKRKYCDRYDYKRRG